MACRKVDGQITDLRGPAFITSSDETLSGGTGCKVKSLLSPVDGWEIELIAMPNTNSSSWGHREGTNHW